MSTWVISEFCTGFNNYKCEHRNLLRNEKRKQDSFHAHFVEGVHQGECDWELRLINQVERVDKFRRIEFYWQHELDTFQQNWSNDPEVALFNSIKLRIYYIDCFLISPQHLYYWNGTNKLLSYFSLIFLSYLSYFFLFSFFLISLIFLISYFIE